MKILQVITELGGGGAEKVLAVLAEGLRKTGNSVFVVSLKERPARMEIPNRLTRNNIRILYLNAGKNSWNLVFRLRSLIRRIKPDVIHTHLVHPNILMRLAAVGTGIPVINTVHTAERRSGQSWLARLDRWTVKRARRITAVSPEAAEHYSRMIGYPLEKIAVVPDAVEKPEIPEPVKLEAYRSLFAGPGITRIIGCVGRLDAMKGYSRMMTLLDPLAANVPKNEKWLILVFGDGAEKAALEKAAAELPYQNLAVRFAGFRPDAPALMKMFDVFLSPSMCEGSGLAVQEAMSIGAPVVCNAVDTMPRLCSAYSGYAGLFDINAPDAAKQMAVCIINAMNSGYGTPQTFMDGSAMTAEWLRIYRMM